MWCCGYSQYFDRSECLRCAELPSQQCHVTYLTHLPNDLNLNTRFVPMKINPEVSLTNPARNCFSNMYHVCFFCLLRNKKFTLFTQKHKHITLHSFYLQYLNTWQSPSKQHNSQFDVLNHKDKWMVGNELSSLRYPCTAQHHLDSCEAKDTHQMLHLFFTQWLNAMMCNYFYQPAVHKLLFALWNFSFSQSCCCTVKSSENWSCDIEWVDPRITVPSSLLSSSHISLTLKVNQEIPAQWCSITLQMTSILPCGLFTDLLRLFLRRMDDFMTKLFIYL